MLVEAEVPLCSQCHPNQMQHTHPVVQKQTGEPLIDPSTEKTLTCASCHTVHGGNFTFITKADRSRDLCLRCHKEGR
jgi:predicted CXXCH cytochrome family protein